MSSAGMRKMETRVLLAPALAALLLAGCGGLLPGHRADVTKPGIPKHAPAGDAYSEMRAHAGAEPKEPYWPFHLAELLVAADSLNAADAAIDQALARDPSYAPALALQSRLDWQAGRHAQAIERLEAARSRAGAAGLPGALLAGLALHYDAVGRSTEAAAVMREIADREPEVGAARVYVALRGDKPGDATALADDVARQLPNSAPSRNNYGITRLRAGDPDAAQHAFLEAIQLDASLPGPYYNLAILEKFYRFDDAEAARWFTAYRKRAQDDPDSLAAYFAKDGAK